MSDVIGYGLAYEVVKRLENAGLTPGMAQDIVGSRGNKKAKAMVATLNGEATPAVPAEQFELLKDLGTMVVPEGYVHETCLANLCAECQKKGLKEKIYYFNSELKDANFSNPSVVLAPGRKLRVRAFKQVVDVTTSAERLAFIASQKGINTGAQGLALVFNQKRGELPKGLSYLSMDEKERLWQDADGDYRVPALYCDTDGCFELRLDYFGFDWSRIDVLLVFSDSDE